MSAAPTKVEAIPSAGVDMRHLLDQEVVIGETAGPATGAQAIEPSHSPRATLSGQPAQARVLPRTETLAAADLHREVEQFVYLQAELLDFPVQVGCADGLGPRQDPRLRRLARERGARRMARLDRLRAGGRAGRLAADHHFLVEQVAHVDARARNRLDLRRRGTHGAAPFMYFFQALNWLRITTSEVPWFE